MRVTICELPDDRASFLPAWEALVAHAQAERSQLVLLPEMPFTSWPFGEAVFVQTTWEAARDAHRRAIEQLRRLHPASVVASRPALVRGNRVNEAFLSESQGERPLHEKRYLPDEAGFWEASWYARGDGRFECETIGHAKAGVLICSELWFFERSRAYGRVGAHIVLCPRATGESTVERWIVGGRAAAIVGGVYCLSSNRTGSASAGVVFGGAGFAADPEGNVLAVTSCEKPFVTLDIDLEAADRAKQTYPRYLRDDAEDLFAPGTRTARSP
jgi:N-carbamoylputrescine amidase